VLPVVVEDHGGVGSLALGAVFFCLFFGGAGAACPHPTLSRKRERGKTGISRKREREKPAAPANRLFPLSRLRERAGVRASRITVAYRKTHITTPQKTKIPRRPDAKKPRRNPLIHNK
jgi:hypothetical protein